MKKWTQKVSDVLRVRNLMLTTRDNVAHEVGAFPSRLSEKLSAEGTTYSRILFYERRRRFVEIMERDPLQGAKAIARVTGYRGHDNVLKMIPRWVGMSLREYRAQLLEGAALEK